MSTDISAPITKEAVEPIVKRVVAKALDVDVEELSAASSLQLDFNAQSLDMLDISFALEREFRVPFPQTDLLQRAGSQFDEEMFVQKGRVTDLGLRLLQTGMPEAEQVRIKPGLKAVDVVGLITVDTFTRLVVRLLEAKADFPRGCPKCGTVMEESDSMPEFVCGSCGEIVPLPSGDEVLMKDFQGLFEEFGPK
jgi:acyl carrier protein